VGIDLEAYAGHYSGQPWGSETLVLPWAGGLAAMPLPVANPADAITLLKPKGSDSFRVVRDDGSEAEEVTFVRDSSGKVTGFRQFSNTKLRLPVATEPKVSLH
jgi:hypothetical protein